MCVGVCGCGWVCGWGRGGLGQRMQPPLPTPPLSPLTPSHPWCQTGGWLFDPLRLSADPSRYERARVAEIKHGRLAMVAWVGFAAQAAATREGPVHNLVEWWGGA